MADHAFWAAYRVVPLILVAQFVGHLAAYRDPGALPAWLAGVLGAVLALWVTFAPCFLWIFVGAPWVERLRESRALRGALTGITAAVVGVILNLAVWFSLHVLFARVGVLRAGPLAIEVPVWSTLDPAALAIAVAAAFATLRFHASLFVLLLTTLLSVRVADAVVAFAPGAQDSMMVLALSLHLDPIFIGAHHLSRYLLVSLSIPLIGRWLGPPPPPMVAGPTPPPAGAP